MQQLAFYFGRTMAKEKKMFASASSLIFKRAADLRKRQTLPEELLWNYLRTKPLGLKFRRQHPFSRYILDFYCHALRLAIEVDGSIHDLEEIKENDKIRQSHLEEQGLTVLRFTNSQITSQFEKVVEQLEIYLQGLPGSKKHL